MHNTHFNLFSPQLSRRSFIIVANTLDVRALCRATRCCTTFRYFAAPVTMNTKATQRTKSDETKQPNKSAKPTAKSKFKLVFHAGLVFATRHRPRARAQARAPLRRWAAAGTRRAIIL